MGEGKALTKKKSILGFLAAKIFRNRGLSSMGLGLRSLVLGLSSAIHRPRSLIGGICSTRSIHSYLSSGNLPCLSTYHLLPLITTVNSSGEK